MRILLIALTLAVTLGCTGHITVTMDVNGKPCVFLLPNQWSQHRGHRHLSDGPYDGKICGNWSPFKDECQASFFTDSHPNEDIEKDWQTYCRSGFARLP